MASQQQPRGLFRFASMVRPAPAAQPPAPAAPTPQPLFRTATLRPPVPSATTTTTTITTTPTQPQEGRPQTPVTAVAAPPVVTLAPPSPVAAPQPAVSVPRSPISAAQPQPVSAASPRSTPTTPPPKSPVAAATAPSPPVFSPPPPRSPVVAQPQRAATDVPKSPVIKLTPSVPQSPLKKVFDVPKESAPITPYSSLPPSPKTKSTETAAITPFSSLPPSPKTKTVDPSRTLNQTSPQKAPSPAQKSIQTNSPQIKPVVSQPPSPLKLPPSQLELDSRNIPQQVDQKTVVVQETMRANNHESTRNAENGKREVKKEKVVQQKKNVRSSDTEEDNGMSVLTLAGENKGAIMELSPSRNKYSPMQKQASPKAWSSEEDGEKSGSESEKASKKRMGNKSLPMTAFMNSNVQGVNNSILHNASCTHHDPGVHLVFSRKPNGYHIKGSPRS